MSISEKANDLLNKFGRTQFDYVVWNTPDNAVARDKARQEISDYIEELEAAHRWRVVANGELPKNNDYYWAHDDLGQQGMILFYDGEWNKFTNLSYITHWMPLPSAPESEDK